MVKPLISVLPFVICYLGTCSISAQNLLQNGDFEFPGFNTSPDFRYLTGTNSQSVTGWTAIDDGVGEPPYYSKLPNYPDHVHHGSYGFALNQGARLRTTFQIERNTRYQLTFWTHVSDCPACLTPQPLQVTIPGISAHVLPLVGWHLWKFEFDSQENDPAAVLEFIEKSPPGDFTGYGLDDISVVKIEPPKLSAKAYPKLQIEGVVGYTYRIEISENLGQPNSWKPLQDIALTRGSLQFTDANILTNSKRFYRAVELR